MEYNYVTCLVDVSILLSYRFCSIIVFPCDNSVVAVWQDPLCKEFGLQDYINVVVFSMFHEDSGITDMK